ncbi:MAG: cytochrome o ubiquinol oxidase subunit IV [Candidatus Makana argininalis]
MNKKKKKIKKNNLNKKEYFLGFLFSLFFTILSFIIVNTNLHSIKTIIYILILFFINIMIHFIFFLKINKNTTSIWYIVSFLFTLLISIILICGSCLIFNSIGNHFIN